MADEKEFTQDDKRRILEKLNHDRLVNQKANRGLDGKKALYTDEEKQKILDELNAHRLTVQKMQNIEKNRTKEKEIFHLEGKEYYRLRGMEREYYIRLDDIPLIGNQGKKFNIYYKAFAGLKSKEVLIKVEVYSEQFFISYDMQRIYYKGYNLYG